MGSHIPPHFKEVPELIDQLLSVIHENWDVMDLLPLSRSMIRDESELLVLDLR